jgi:hypothetical protein
MNVPSVDGVEVFKLEVSANWSTLLDVLELWTTIGALSTLVESLVSLLVLAVATRGTSPSTSVTGHSFFFFFFG